jgi:hypothetical protein
MPESVLIPVTYVRLLYVPGLDETNRSLASYKDTFVYGVDMTGDEVKYELWYSQYTHEHRLAVEFVAGVQIAFPDMVVTAKQS